VSRSDEESKGEVRLENRPCALRGLSLAQAGSLTEVNDPVTPLVTGRPPNVENAGFDQEA
jgi:hypothetical protein